jgi:hypothetical protein
LLAVANLSELRQREVRRIYLLETVWKLPPDMMMAYALRHGDHQIPHGSVR